MDSDDPTSAARRMRDLKPRDREKAILYGVLEGKVIDIRYRFHGGAGATRQEFGT